VAESDIANCFEAIPHSGLVVAIEERTSDRHVLKLLRAMLRAEVMQDGAVTRWSFHPAWPTSTCTGSTGSGQAAARASWSAAPMIVCPECGRRNRVEATSD
jgi:hypothetical protein